MTVLREQGHVPLWELLAWLEARGVKLVDTRGTMPAKPSIETLRALVNRFLRESEASVHADALIGGRAANPEAYDRAVAAVGHERAEAARQRSEAGDTLDASRGVPGPYSGTGTPPTPRLDEAADATGYGP